jgi:hypothetical protein
MVTPKVSPKFEFNRQWQIETGSFYQYKKANRQSADGF